MMLDMSGVAALIVALITLYKVIKTGNKEVLATDAEAADKYASASSKVAEHNAQLYTRIDMLESKAKETSTKLENLEGVIELLRKKLRTRDALLAEWERGIHIILEQLCEANIMPKWNPPKLLEDLHKEEGDNEK